MNEILMDASPGARSVMDDVAEFGPREAAARMIQATTTNRRVLAVVLARRLRVFPADREVFAAARLLADLPDVGPIYLEELQRAWARVALLEGRLGEKLGQKGEPHAAPA